MDPPTPEARSIPIQEEPMQTTTEPARDVSPLRFERDGAIARLTFAREAVPTSGGT
jgi:hypothetical protein